MSLHSVIEQYRRALPPGDLLQFSLSPLERLGVECYSATFFPPDGRTRGGVGYGLTEEAAFVSALGEMTEEFSAARGVAQLERIEGSFNELKKRFGERGVCDPLTLCLEAGSDYTPDTPRRWVETKRLGTDESVWIPVEFVATYRGDVIQNYEPLVTPITNGLGAGTSFEMALSHGLLELLQRDGNGLQIRALASPIELNLDSIADADVRQILDSIERENIEVRVKIASLEDGFVNLYVVGLDRDERSDSVVKALAGGEASHPSALEALKKALLEWCAARARIAFMHGPLEAVESMVPPGYKERILSGLDLSKEEPRALQAMADWQDKSLGEVRALFEQQLFRCERKLPFDELPSSDLNSDKVALAREIVRRLHRDRFDILVADFSHVTGQEVHVLKVIVPGLEVETMSYGRIGERNVRRLINRDDVRLAGVGNAPEGAEKVRLTPAAEARLGGEAWFDRTAANRLIGPLYCIYREPGRHTTALFRSSKSSKT